MRLVTFKSGSALAAPRVGAMLGDESVVDLADAMYLRLCANGLTEAASRRVAEALIPPDMTAFLEGGETSDRAARDALGWAADHRASAAVHARDAVRLLAPVPRPPTFRDGNFFEGHTRAAAARMGGEIHPNWFRIPAFYKGTPSSIGGPQDAVRIPPYTQALDYEFEYAVVIGRRGRDIAAADAWRHIAGLMILNDFSARDQQGVEMPLLMGPAKGKDFDGGTVTGPYLVTLDEIVDVEHLRIVGRVNGEVVCEASSGDAHWKWPEVIAYVSRSETLLPGDIVASGTVPGGSRLESGAGYLSPGDVVEEEVSNLGILRTEIAAASEVILA